MGLNLPLVSKNKLTEISYLLQFCLQGTPSFRGSRFLSQSHDFHMTTTPGCLACVIWGSIELQWSMKLYVEESRAFGVYFTLVLSGGLRIPVQNNVFHYYYWALLNFRERTVRFVWFKVWFKGTGALGGMCDNSEGLEACPDVRVDVILRNGDCLKTYWNISKHVQTYHIKLVQNNVTERRALFSTRLQSQDPGLGGWRGRSREWIPLTELPPSCLCYIILLLHCLDFFSWSTHAHIQTCTTKIFSFVLDIFYVVDGWFIFRNRLGPGRNAVKRFVCLSTADTIRLGKVTLKTNS